MSLNPKPFEARNQRPNSTVSGKTQELDIVSDYGDAVSENEVYFSKDTEDEFHDAPEIKDVKINNVGNKISLQRTKKPLQKLNNNTVPDENPASKINKFGFGRDGDSPSIKVPNISGGKKTRKSHALGSQSVLGIQSDVNVQKIQKSLGKSSLEESDSKKNSLRDRKMNERKSFSLAPNEGKDGLENRGNTSIPVSGNKMIKQTKPMLELENRPSGGPQTLEIKRLVESNRKREGGNESAKSTMDLVSRKRSSGSLSTLLQKRCKQVTLENYKGPATEETGFEKNTPKRQVKSANGRSRLEEIKSIKQKIAAAKQSCTSAVSVNHLTRNNPYMDIFSKNKPISQRKNITLSEPINERASSNSNPVKLALEENNSEVVLECDKNDKQPDGLTEVENMYMPSHSQIDAVSNEQLERSTFVAITDSAINTDPTSESQELIQLKKEKYIHLEQENNLKNDNQALKDVICKQQKKEIELKKELSSLSDTLIKTNEVVQEMGKKISEKDLTMAQLRCNLNKLQCLNERLKEKDVFLNDLEKQLSILKSDSNKMKMELEKRNSEIHLLIKEKEELTNAIVLLRKDRDGLQEKVVFISNKLKEEQNENTDLRETLIQERVINKDIKEKCEIMEKKLIDESSTNILGLSEQLLEKDTIISDLEKLRDRVQLLNKEVCGMLASVFKEYGKPKSEREIETLISSGRILTIKHSLISLLESKSNKEAEVVHEECQKVIFNLEDRAAVLEAELEESKNYSETLAEVISNGNIWGPERDGEEECQLGRFLQVEQRHGVDNIGDTCNSSKSGTRIPMDHYELYVLLETKRQALMRMERKMQELEEIHSNCSQKRVRNEMRIDQLETALAELKYHQ